MFRPSRPFFALLVLALSVGFAACTDTPYRKMYSPTRNRFVPPPPPKVDVPDAPVTPTETMPAADPTLPPPGAPAADPGLPAGVPAMPAEGAPMAIPGL